MSNFDIDFDEVFAGYTGNATSTENKEVKVSSKEAQKKVLTKKKEKKYSGDFTVHTLKGTCKVKAEKLSASEILEKAAKVLDWPVQFYDTVVTSKDVYPYAKATLAFNGELPDSFLGYKLLLASGEEVVADGDELEKLRDERDELQGCEFLVDPDGGIIVPYYRALANDAKVVLPVTITHSGVEYVIDTEPRPKPKKEAAEKPEDKSDEEDDEEEITEEDAANEPAADKEVSLSAFLGMILKKIGLSKLNTDYFSVARKGSAYVLVLSAAKVFAYATNASLNKPVEEKKYPLVPGLEIRLGYAKINLFEHPMMEGKTEVTEKEVLKVLQHEFEEYTDKTRIEYRKGKNGHYFLPSYPSSSKGADMEIPSGIFVHMGDLIAYQSPIGTAVVDKLSQEGLFRFGLPDIPTEIFESIANFFAYFAKQSLEAFALIIYNEDAKEYRVEIPEQRVSCAHVDTQQFFLDEDEIVVAECHSHHIMGCSFSSQDDRDDKKPLLYVLYRNYSTVHREFLVEARIGLKGYFHSVALSTLSSDYDYDDYIWVETSNEEVDEAWLAKVEEV